MTYIINHVRLKLRFFNKKTVSKFVPHQQNEIVENAKKSDEDHDLIRIKVCEGRLKLIAGRQGTPLYQLAVGQQQCSGSIIYQLNRIAMFMQCLKVVNVFNCNHCITHCSAAEQSCIGGSVVYQSVRQMLAVSEHYTLPSRPDTPICYPTLSYCTSSKEI